MGMLVLTRRAARGRNGVRGTRIFFGRDQLTLRVDAYSDDAAHLRFTTPSGYSSSKCPWAAP